MIICDKSMVRVEIMGEVGKLRHKARRVWLRLRDEYGFEGSEPSVRRIVAALRHRPPEVFIPLAHEPGEEAQDLFQVFCREGSSQ